MSWKGRKDPMESATERVLIDAGIAWTRDDAKSGLDFYLPDYDVYVEVKRYHTDRIAEQMSRRPNVIAIQGLDALKVFARLVGPQ